MMKTNHYIVVILAMILTGCGMGGAESGPAEPDVEITASVEDQTYTLEDTLAIHTRVENVSDEPIEYTSGSCDHHPTLEMGDLGYFFEGDYGEEGMPVCTMELRYLELASGEVLEHTYTFNGRRFLDDPRIYQDDELSFTVAFNDESIRELIDLDIKPTDLDRVSLTRTFQMIEEHETFQAYLGEHDLSAPAEENLTVANEQYDHTHVVYELQLDEQTSFIIRVNADENEIHHISYEHSDGETVSFGDVYTTTLTKEMENTYMSKGDERLTALVELYEDAQDEWEEFIDEYDAKADQGMVSVSAVNYVKMSQDERVQHIQSMEHSGLVVPYTEGDE
ncbi:hypothetical protein JCM19037_1351 [Geomicrobium sp. JCM 19037]|uniref:hypothetical protein n=1 Tax=unclassified Geomicrobium TaxID=2628951 RepID=UPI00045F1949|nr:hypothetical protein [Geomicrobium sp. JCM 19037]GAK03065.1 hypothetical protein JCM19037_1351 [Geomicrobium sp. JCM 19037]